MQGDAFRSSVYLSQDKGSKSTDMTEETAEPRIGNCQPHHLKVTQDGGVSLTDVSSMVP